MEQTRVKAGHIELVQVQNIQTCETDALGMHVYEYERD